MSYTDIALPTASLLKPLLESSIVAFEDFELLDESDRATLEQATRRDELLRLLLGHGLLTDFQARRVEAGKMFGLIVNNYRVLERLGAGSMGVVFKAEHVRLRKAVAIKILSPSYDRDERILSRFYSEIRAIARLQHPNIVAAIDAGSTPDGGFEAPSLHYLVMEYVPGKDLEEYVIDHGPISVTSACDMMYQIASALEESHRHQLVHRDLKPSNVRVTPDGRAKLLDFGLTRHRQNRMTEPGLLVGTVDFMAPEQAQDASNVDIRADLYGLGGILYWCLSGKQPFPATDNLVQALAQRQSEPPPSLRKVRPDLPAKLDAVLAKLLAVKPEDRYATPRQVMQALLPFLKEEETHFGVLRDEPVDVRIAAAKQRRILIVDDEPIIRSLCRYALQADDVKFAEAADAVQALELARSKPFDLILLDIDLPGMKGHEVLAALRADPPWPNLKIVMFSGRSAPDEMAQLMLAGADDYLVKPFTTIQLQARVRSALRLKEAQDQASTLNSNLLRVNSELERNLTDSSSDLVQARNALVLALAKLVEYRDSETGQHLARLQRFCRCLASEAALSTLFSEQIDANFIDMLECCAPLHDIGKVGLPDHILLKPGKLMPDERVLMQAHTIIGAETLGEVARQHNFALVFLQMSVDIARSHHERYDGSGYPDKLAGAAIPLAARIVAICDAYDAMRSRRVYKPALSHLAALELIVEHSPGHFDPVLLQAFERCAPRFDQIFSEYND
jgi:response regulator RpfG family c-di-GMP phosphodiesterase